MHAESDHVWKRVQPVWVGVGVGITLAPSQVCDPGKERQLPHLPEPREAKLSSR